MPQVPADAKRHAWIALIGATTIACGVFVLLVNGEPDPPAGHSGAHGSPRPARHNATIAAVGLAPSSRPTAEALPDDEDAGAPAPHWELRGHVVDVEGRPIPDVVLEVIQPGTGARTVSPGSAGPTPLGADLPTPDNLGVTRGPIPPIPLAGTIPVTAGEDSGFITDTRGRFVLTGTETGTVELLAGPAGWAPTRLGPLKVTPGDVLNDLRLVLRRGARVEGAVIDPRGYPLKGVKVESFCTDDPLPHATLSDASGRFAFQGLLGACEVVATPAELPMARLSVRAVDGVDQLIEVRVTTDAHSLECTIQDQRGFPINAATVEVRAPGDTGLLAAAVSGPDGSVTVQRLPPPPYLLTVSHVEFAPAQNVPLAGLVGNRITLGPATRTIGTVLVKPGQSPLSGARIEVWSGAGVLTYSTRTGTLGTFELHNVTSDNKYIIISHPQVVQRRFPVPTIKHLPGHSVADWGAFEVEEGGSVSGTVVDRLGVPVPAARVIAETAETITDADGNFVLSGLAAGMLAVHARHHSAGASRQAAAVRVFAGQDQPGTRLQLTGRLADDASQQAPSATSPGSQPAPSVSTAVEQVTPAGSNAIVELATGRAGVTVTSVAPGSTAASAGLRPGDTIASIDNETVMIAGQARSLLRGEPGTWVTLQVRRGGGQVRIKFRREPRTAP